MNSRRDLKSVETGSWFHILITRSEKNTALVLWAQFLLEFESMTACLSGKIPLEEIFEFKHSKTKDNSIAPC